jgi:transposase
MEVYCGIDWAEPHHDVAVVDFAGEVLVQRRIGDDLAGFTALTAVLDQLATGRDEVGIALETDRGLFVRALRSGGFRVFAINPKAVDRYRDRYRVSRAKSDPVDAVVLANLLRPDADGIGRSRPILIWPRRCRFWPAPSRTLPGSGAGRPPASEPSFGSSTRLHCRPFRT